MIHNLFFLALTAAAIVGCSEASKSPTETTAARTEGGSAGELPGISAATAAQSPCGLIVSPNPFTLDITGTAYPRSGQLDLLINWCNGNGWAEWNPNLAYWASSNPNVISVSGGWVTANTAGVAEVCALVGERQACANGRVLAERVINRVAVSPSSVATYFGQTVQLTATAYDQYDLPYSGASFAWSSSNTAAASVSSSGLVTGQGDGTATVSACAGTRCGHSAISVTYLNVYIAGPRNVPYSYMADPSCTWTAVVNGGRAPFTYAWRRDGVHVSSGPTYTIYTPLYQSSMILEVTVTDAIGVTRTAGAGISATGSNRCT